MNHKSQVVAKLLIKYGKKDSGSRKMETNMMEEKWTCNSDRNRKVGI